MTSTAPALRGIHNIRIPVTDLDRSFPWYQKVFGFELEMEFFTPAGDRNGLVIVHPSGARLILMEFPDRVAGFRGFDPIAFAVRDRPALQAWADHLTDIDVPNPGVHKGHLGWTIVDVEDPDGIRIRIYTDEIPDEDAD